MRRPVERGLVLALVPLLLSAAGAGAQEAGYPTEPPPPLEAREVAFPAVGRDTLDNGLELVVVENHEQPVVSVRLYVPAGEIADPEGTVGVANLTARTLDEGTTTRSAAEIASTVEGAGASLQTGASDDYAFVATSVLTGRLPTVLQVLADVVRNPAFPAEEVANERRRMRSSLQQQLAQPDVLASRRFRKAIYGSHPYAEEPTPESVAGIERPHLVAFHRERYTPRGSLLVFAGDIDLEGARRAAREHFGGWTGKATPEVVLPEPPPAGAFAIHLVHRPGSAQSAIRVGHLGLEPGSDDRYAVDVMNRILGAGPASRLFRVLREEKGWTYGAFSRFTDPRHRGLFVAGASVRNPVTDSTLAETVDQLRRIRDEPVPAEELADAKSYITGHFPLEIETPQQVASRVADVLLRGLEIDYLETYRGRIAEVGAGEVQRAAREHLRPDSATAVVVGDAARVHGELTALGPVALLDADGDRIDPSELEVARSDVALEMDRARRGSFTYSLLARGNAVGRMSLSVERDDDGRHRVRQETSAGAVSRTLSYAVTPDVSPVSVTVEGRMGPVQLARDLRYEDGRVRGTATIPEQPAAGQPPSTREVTVDTTVAEGTLDAEMDLAALLASPLAEGFTLEVPVFEPGRGVGALEARVTGTETVSVAAGEFETWVVEVSLLGQAVTAWVTRSEPRMLVKQEVAGQPVSLELQEVVGGGSGG